MASPQHLRLAYRRVLVAPYWHIEFAFGVDAPQAVVTGLVEVDKASGYFNAVIELMLAADVIIVIFAVLRSVFAQFDNKRLGVALDDLVGDDEVKVNIT